MLSIGIDVGGTTVKTAALRDGQFLSTSRAGPYSRPDPAQLAAAIREACRGIPDPIDRVGICVPGILDEPKRRIVNSANLPELAGANLHELLRAALGLGAPAPQVITDANATAFDLHATRCLRGRLLVIAIGTGVGAAVLDDGKPLFVDGESPGHLGQVDVSLEAHPVIGPDRGRGSLEGYIGAKALAERYGHEAANKIRPADPAFAALARAIRICHAIYRPHHVCLAGGVGIRLGHLVDELRTAVNADLTGIARPDWTLTTGDSDFHAARGAAQFAASHGQ